MLFAIVALPAFADTAPPSSPPPRLDPPPQSQQQNCQWYFGYHLRSDGPPIPFLELRCS